MSLSNLCGSSCGSLRFCKSRRKAAAVFRKAAEGLGNVLIAVNTVLRRHSWFSAVLCGCRTLENSDLNSISGKRALTSENRDLNSTSGKGALTPASSGVLDSALYKSAIDADNKQPTTRNLLSFLLSVG